MKIICIGRNYSDHAKEMKADVPEKPMFFMKPETALLKSPATFYYPEFSKDIHFECELVVRISKAGKHIAESFAPKYYDAIGLGIDFTARDLQSECKKNGHPWEVAKAFDHSAVISSEFISTKALDLNSIQFSMTQNNELRQAGNSSEMLFGINRLVSYVSQFVTLKTGDLIYTGTPAGVGPIAIGDTLKGYIEEKLMFEIQVG